MKTHFLFIALLMIFPSINAQFMPVVTPSPEAASLGSIAKLPVDYHTGQVNVEIPLLEVEQNGFKLPIKLTYDTSGILINNRTTWVGTNWTLDAGGIITRTVKGEADENGDKRFWKNGGKLDNPQWYELPYLINTVFKGALNMVSLEPDEFNFKAPGISGTFYIGNDQKAHIVGQPDMKIEISSHLVHAGGDNHYHPAWQYIKITASNGNIYNFQIQETSAPLNPQNNTLEGFSTSWLLHSITFPQSKDKLQFSYSNEYNDISFSYQEMYSASSYKLDNGKWIKHNNDTYQYFIGERQYTIGHRYLESIEGNNFKIDFIRSKQSSIVTEPKWCQLKSIILSRKSDNKQIKKIQLDYDKSDANQRFWLNTVHIYGQNSTEALPPYRLDYYPYDQRLAFYDYYSYADFWGYYKGTSGNLIPNIIKDADDLYYSPERNPNPSTITQGMLQKITYPTGGFIKFIYEPNDYSMYGETRKDTSIQMCHVKKTVNELSQLIDSKISIGGGLRIKELSY